MNHQNIHEFLSRKISILNGVGEKTKKLFRCDCIKKILIGAIVVLVFVEGAGVYVIWNARGNHQTNC